MKDWFTIDQVDESTYIISEYWHWEETHCYLLIGSDRALLIDTGLGICNICEQVRKLTDKPVTAVATHIHWDHIGGHKYFSNFYAHEAELDWLNGKFPLPAQAVKNMLTNRCELPGDFDISNYDIFQGKPSRMLEDGDIIDLGGRIIRVLHTPGHSPGHLCFWEAERGHLFSGDLVYKGTLFANYPSTDPQSYLDSLEKIAGLPAKRIFPGHHGLDICPDVVMQMRDGHTADTPENRELLLRVCNDESNYMGTDQNGNRWYVQILSDGRQVWVTTRDGIIQNAGINNVALPWHEDTGLNQPRNKGADPNMESTPCRRAFLSMYYLLDSIYSQFPYRNLAVVLGDINPTLFKGSMSADPAAWQDFCEYYEEARDAYSSEFEVGYYTAIRFLRVYEEEWAYPIPYAMEEFTTEKYREYYYNQE